MTITIDMLDALQALCDAATPGEAMHLATMPTDDLAEQVAYFAECARHGSGKMHGVAIPVCAAVDINDEALFVAFTGNGPTSEANAKFIAAAREAMPLLVAEVRTARAALNALGIGPLGGLDDGLASGINLLASALAAAQETARVASGNYDGLLDAIELSGKRRQAEIAGYWRRIDSVERQCQNLIDGRRARDQAIADAGVACAQLRGALAKAEAERDEAQKALAWTQGEWTAAGHDLATERKLLDLANAAFGGIEQACGALPTYGGGIPLDQRIALAAVDLDKAERERNDSDGTLEAVRAELLRVTEHRDNAWRTKDLMYDSLCDAWRIVRDLRRRLSEVSREKDPQRNVTAGLLRVEQAQCDRWRHLCYERNGEIARLKAALVKMRDIWADDDLGPSEAGHDMHVVVLDTLEPDAVQRAEASVSPPAPLDPETGAAILRHLRVEKAIEAEERRACQCTNEPGDSPCPIHDCEHGEHPADCAVCTPPTPFTDALEQAAATGSATLVGPTGTITITRDPRCPLHGAGCPTANDPDLAPDEVDP
jgi:hypothetical protein